MISFPNWCQQLCLMAQSHYIAQSSSATPTGLKQVLICYTLNETSGPKTWTFRLRCFLNFLQRNIWLCVNCQRFESGNLYLAIRKTCAECLKAWGTKVSDLLGSFTGCYIKNGYKNPQALIPTVWPEDSTSALYGHGYSFRNFNFTTPSPLLATISFWSSNVKTFETNTFLTLILPLNQFLLRLLPLLWLEHSVGITSGIFKTRFPGAWVRKPVSGH